MKRKLSRCETTKDSNKVEKITQLIQEHINASSDNTIIQELQTWLNEAKEGQESLNKLALILIKNDLNPCENSASWLLKIALPTIFKKEELANLLETDLFSEDEKAKFQESYLNNLVDINPQPSLNTTINFFSLKSTPKEIQKEILSYLSTKDLINITTTSKELHALKLEILFQQTDKLAVEFQEKIMEKMAQQLLREGAINSQSCLNEQENWIPILTSIQNRPQLSIIYKIYTGLLLQYFGGTDFEKIKSNLAETISKINALKPMQVNFQRDYVRNKHQAQKNYLLTSLTGKKSKEEMDSLLYNINVDKNNQEIYYAQLILILPDLSETQLKSLIEFCLKKTVLNWESIPNLAWNTLKRIMKLTDTSVDSQAFLIKIINEDRACSEQSALKRDKAFLLLFELARTKNPKLFETLFSVVRNKINDNQDKQGRGYYWLSILAPYLRFDDQFISELIKNLRDLTDTGLYNAQYTLEVIAKQLTVNQLANFSYPCLLGLNEAQPEIDLIYRLNLIKNLASSFSPCPYEIVQKLVSWSNHKEKKIANTAISTLLNLEPNLIVIQSGILEYELMSNLVCTAVYEYIVKLAPLLRSKDITSGFIKGLIDSKPTNPELKKKALAAMSKELDDSQLTLYINNCLRHKEPLSEALCLTAIPSAKLIGKIDDLVKKYTNQLKSQAWEIREQACESIYFFYEILSLFPENFLAEVAGKLNDENYSVRFRAAQTLPKIIHLINDNYIEAVFELFLSKLGFERREIILSACKCISLLVPRVSQNSIKRAKEKLVINLEHEDLQIKNSSFSALTQIAQRFKADDLTSLIVILTKKSDPETFKYLRDLIKLLTDDSIAINSVSSVLFTALELDSCSIRAEACSILIEIASCSSASDELIRKIISSFIAILTNQGSDLAEQLRIHNTNLFEIKPNQDRTVILNGLIKLANLLNDQEFKTLLELPSISFDMIATMHLLNVTYKPKYQLETYCEVEAKFIS